MSGVIPPLPYTPQWREKGGKGELQPLFSVSIMITWKAVTEIKPGLIGEYCMEVNRFEMAQDCFRVIVVCCRCSETVPYCKGTVRSISNSNQLTGIQPSSIRTQAATNEHTSNTRLMIQSLKCNRLSYAGGLE